jgi:hypothetical protein
MSVLGEFAPGGEVHDALKTQPDRLHAELAVALAPKEAAEARDQGQHRVEARWLFGQGFLRQDVGRLSLLGREQQGRVQIGER